MSVKFCLIVKAQFFADMSKTYGDSHCIVRERRATQTLRRGHAPHAAPRTPQAPPRAGLRARRP